MPDIIHASIAFGGQTRPFRLFDTKLCQTVCAEIFRGESYPPLAIDSEVRTILDVGANIGAASVYFAAQYPQARIFACEPSSLCFPLLVENTRACANITLANVGLSNRNGTAALFHGRGDQVTNSLAASSLNTTESELVELRDAGEFARTVPGGVDLLKLDTEGHELPILESLQALLPSIAVVYVEYHSEPDRRAIDAVFLGSHTLWRSSAETPHRGELAYVRSDLVPQQIRALCIR